MIIMGATREPLFRNFLAGNVSQQVTEHAPCPVLMVKRRSGIITSTLRETVLHPVLNAESPTCSLATDLKLRQNNVIVHIDCRRECALNWRTCLRLCKW